MNQSKIYQTNKTVSHVIIRICVVNLLISSFYEIYKCKFNTEKIFEKILKKPINRQSKNAKNELAILLRGHMLDQSISAFLKPQKHVPL